MSSVSSTLMTLHASLCPIRLLTLTRHYGSPHHPPSFHHLIDWCVIATLHAGHELVTERLIGIDADVNATTSGGQTPLHYAVRPLPYTHPPWFARAEPFTRRDTSWSTPAGPERNGDVVPGTAGCYEGCVTREAPGSISGSGVAGLCLCCTLSQQATCDQQAVTKVGYSERCV